MLHIDYAFNRTRLLKTCSLCAKEFFEIPADARLWYPGDETDGIYWDCDGNDMKDTSWGCGTSLCIRGKAALSLPREERLRA